MDNSKRRIYSINTVAYALAKDTDLIKKLDVHSDEEEPGKVYFSIDEDISDLMREYKEDEFIQRFIVNYKHLKDLIYMTRNQQR